MKVAIITLKVLATMVLATIAIAGVWALSDIERRSGNAMIPFCAFETILVIGILKIWGKSIF